MVDNFKKSAWDDAPMKTPNWDDPNNPIHIPSCPDASQQLKDAVEKKEEKKKKGFAKERSGKRG